MNRFSEQPENTSTKRKLTDNLLIIYILTTLLGANHGFTVRIYSFHDK